MYEGRDFVQLARDWVLPAHKTKFSLGYICTRSCGIVTWKYLSINLGVKSKLNI